MGKATLLYALLIVGIRKVAKCGYFLFSVDRWALFCNSALVVIRYDTVP